ncbi:MAG: hypothetical protein ABW211_04600 [Acidimicrobiia bacterium]
MTRTQDTRTSETRTTWIARLIAVAITLLALAGVALAPAAAGAATAPTTATTISTAKNDKLGTILVSDGNTVYTVKSKSACTSACAKTWVAVVLPDGTTSASAGNGVDASKLGTKKTADGALQITYGGKPLYWSTKDKSSGQVHAASDKYGTWSAVVTGAAKSGSGSGDTGTSSPSTGGAAF